MYIYIYKCMYVCIWIFGIDSKKSGKKNYFLKLSE